MKTLKRLLQILVTALVLGFYLSSCTLQKAVVETDNDTEKIDGNKRLKDYDQKNRGK
ncbi:MAG: hypothetical protein JNM63_03740 [Spirochaetia bacterium]|nr:hypothetical protein [Spirochaetia bacterium]